MNPDVEAAFAILLTDRAELGRAIRLLKDDGDPTLHPRMARLFERERDAKAWMTRTYADYRTTRGRGKRDLDHRYLYTVAEIAVPPRRPRPVRELTPPLPLVWE